MSSASVAAGEPRGDDTLDRRAIADGLGLAQGTEGEGKDDEFVRHAVAFLCATRETQAARVACFRRLVPLFMSRAPCTTRTIIERAAMHGFALAFMDEMCGDLGERRVPLGEKTSDGEQSGDDDKDGSTHSSTEPMEPSIGVLCVAKKSEPGPQGSVTYIALTNKDAKVHYQWNCCRRLCLKTPSDADTAAAAAAAAAAAKDADKWGTEYEVVPLQGEPSAPPVTKTLEQVVESVVACFKQHSCRYAEDVTDFTKLFPDISLWQSS